MEEKLELKDFDVVGIINLKDVKGIEKYVTPIIEENGNVKEYLSRSKEYYNVKNMTELSQKREKLKTLVTRQRTKKNFVILENMLNCSAKVYFREFEEYIKNGKNEEFESKLLKAEKCLEEDAKNILVMLEGKGLINVEKGNILPEGEENCERRSIEMDNKAMLYIFLKSLNVKEDPKNIEVLIPGYGSVYIGPFLKAMYGYNYTNLLKSKYIEDTTNINTETIKSLMSSDRIFKDGKTVMLLDDNIGTGSTMEEIKKELNKENVYRILSGAVQYNWRNYLRVSIGDKKDIDRFEVKNFDFVSPMNFAGHKLYSHAIDMLHSSSAEYIQYLNSKSYRQQEYSDLQGVLDRGIFYARKVGLEMAEGRIVPERTVEGTEVLEQYKEGPTKIKNENSKQVISNITKAIDSYCCNDKIKENDRQK